MCKAVGVAKENRFRSLYAIAKIRKGGLASHNYQESYFFFLISNYQESYSWLNILNFMIWRTGEIINLLKLVNDICSYVTGKIVNINSQN
jgi:hypothetical protein